MTNEQQAVLDAALALEEACSKGVLQYIGINGTERVSDVLAVARAYRKSLEPKPVDAIRVVKSDGTVLVRFSEDEIAAFWAALGSMVEAIRKERQ